MKLTIRKTTLLSIAGYLAFLLLAFFSLTPKLHAIENASIRYTGNNASSLDGVAIDVSGASDNDINGRYSYTRSAPSTGGDSVFNEGGIYRFDHVSSRYYIEINQLNVSQGQLKFNNRVFGDDGRGTFIVSNPEIMIGVTGQPYVHPSEYTFRYFDTDDDYSQGDAGIIAERNEGVIETSRKQERYILRFNNDRDDGSSVTFGDTNGDYVIRVQDPCGSPSSAQLLRNFGTAEVGAGAQENTPIRIQGGIDAVKAAYPEAIDCEFDPENDRFVEIQVTITNGEIGECYGPYDFVIRSLGSSQSSSATATGETEGICVQEGTGTYSIPSTTIPGFSAGEYELTFPEMPEGNNATRFRVEPNLQRTFVEFQIAQELAPVRDNPENNTNENDQTCEDVTGAWSWMICGLLRVTSNGLNTADEILNAMLRTPDEYIVSDAAEAAWLNFRNLAYILLVPAILIMVIGTTLGFEFVSAYTVKKALPRMIAATIFIAFSYEITSFIISAVNTIGVGIQGFLAGAAGQDEFSLANNFPAPGNGPIALSWIGLGAGVGGTIGFIGGGGFFVFLGFLMAAILAVLGALLLLGFRQVGIMVLAILAPLAIIAWIFPGNTKLWGLWRTTFLKLLLLYPIIMLAIGGGKLFASVIAGIDSGADVSASRGIANKLFILVAYIGPYFLIPRLFKTAGSAFANLAGMVNDREKGLIDRSKNWGKQRKQTSTLGQAREAKKKEKIEDRGRSANRMRLARSQFKKGDRSAAMKTISDDLKGTYTPSGRRETREANDALLEAEVAKEGNAVRSGYAQKQASDIKSQAEIFRASAAINNRMQEQINQGNDSKSARSAALASFERELTAKMLRGEATDEEVTGGIAALATQKASKELNNMHEAIAAAPRTAATTKAAGQFVGSFGNDTAFSALQKVNPAITKVGLEPGMGATALRQARGEALRSEQIDKLVGMGESGWDDLAAYAASGVDPTFTMDSVADRYQEIYNMGGEASASLAMPGASKPGQQPNHNDQFRSVLQARGIPIH